MSKFKTDELIKIIQTGCWEEPDFDGELVGFLEVPMPDFFEIERCSDKILFGDGEWQNEPDAKGWIDEATGLRCMIRRHEAFGSLCGYVGVEKPHPAYGLGTYSSESENYASFDCHGGITWTGAMHGDHELKFEIPKSIWWFGFDCAHYRDLVPSFVKQSDLFGFPKGMEMFGETVYRNFAYVEENVKYLAQQIYEYDGQINR